jgi:hypothetical protein
MTTRPLAVESLARTGRGRGDAPSGGRLPLGGRPSTYFTSSDPAQILGQQARLKVALDLLPDRLDQTRQPPRMPRQDLVDTDQINAARRELSEAMREILPSYGPLPGPFE